MGTLLDTQKVYEGRLREFAKIEKLEVAEIPAAGNQSQESGDCLRKVVG